ncbi:MAG: ribonuclease E inhibitor RraB [Rhizorhabdus sp.]
MLDLPFDPARLAEELAADADVVRELRDNGDVPDIVRPVDAHFVGEPATIAVLEGEVEALGWTIVEVNLEEDGYVTLWLQREQATTDAALRALTEDALRIEAAYDVNYDGWGTVAKSGEAG